MPVSIYDIAKKAGVSPSTVSRALEDHPRIGAATRQRIQQIAREMDFVPNAVARSLAVNKTWTIGLILASISDPFMGRVVEGIEYAADEAGFNVLMSTSQNNREREIALIETLRKRRVDGIIILASHLFDRYPSFFESNTVPIVLLNEQNPGAQMHFVSIDDLQGTQLATEHLLALGHRRIGYVGTTDRPKSNQYRLQGYQNALAAAGIPSDPTLICISENTEGHAEAGEACLDQLLVARATAACCYNDTIAIGLLAACYRYGISVPGTFSIIGFDDIDTAAYVIPPLTTIHQPRFELGQQAMHMLLSLLNGQMPPNQTVSGTLVIRQTTARCAPSSIRVS